MPALFRRIVLAASAALLLFAFILLLSPSRQVQASPALRQEATPTAQQDKKDCASCHPEIQEMWYNGAHSSARTNHVMEESSNCTACHPSLSGGQVEVPASAPQSQIGDGKMQDGACVKCHTTGYNAATQMSASYGVTCEACHSPVSDTHPDKDAPVNTNAEMCSQCHSDSRFDWSEWGKSSHYQQNMRCVQCHNPHSTSLRVVGSDASANKSALCIECHEEDEKMSTHSMHGRAGVSCVDCHLGQREGVDTFHVVPNHSFEPNLKTCNNCHIETLHRAAQPGEELPAAVSPHASPTPYDPNATPTQVPTSTPDPAASAPVAPIQNNMMWLGLAVIAGLIGLVVGIAIPNLKLLTTKSKKTRNR